MVWLNAEFRTASSEDAPHNCKQNVELSTFAN